MPKVLFVSPASSLRGGVETILHDLCRELPKRGWTPVLGLASGGRFNDAARYEAVNPGLPVHRIVPQYLVRRARVEAVIDAIRTVQPEVVVCANIADAYEAVARLKVVHSRPRLAVAVRGLAVEMLQDLAWFRHFVDLCIVDGRLVAEACTAIAGIERERVLSVPAGVHAPVAPVTPRIPQRELNVGYVGRIADADKRVLDLIELVRLLERADLPYKLSIIGDGPDLPALKAAFATSGTVAFLGWRSHAELYGEILPGLDCVMNFSPREGVTIAPREAQIHGAVPVLSRFPGLLAEGVFRPGHNALTFEVGDIEQAAHHLVNLHREPGLLERLSTNALCSQTGPYTFEGSMDGWRTALETCLRWPVKLNSGLPNDGPSKLRLERMGVPGVFADWLRSMSGRIPVPREAGAEWPHAYARGGLPAGAHAELERLACKVDAALPTDAPSASRAEAVGFSKQLETARSD
jgi:glycosyltransferase involved in cell wall biosynthesis